MAQRVSVFGCGGQKGGTTTLHAYLCGHRGLTAPTRKETHFFDDEAQDWSRPDYRRYDTFYPGDDGGRLRVDVTPIYGYWEPSLARIRVYNPEAKLIFLWRDPFQRAQSHWAMQVARGAETLSFSEALAAEEKRLAEAGPLGKGRRLHSYVDRGRYASQLRRAYALFPRAQILNLRSEDLFKAHMDTLNRIATFLGIAPFARVEARHEMKRRGRKDAPPRRADFNFVASRLAGEMAEFATLSGLDISGWSEPPAEVPSVPQAAPKESSVRAPNHQPRDSRKIRNFRKT